MLLLEGDFPQKGWGHEPRALGPDGTRWVVVVGTEVAPAPSDCPTATSGDLAPGVEE